MGVLAKMLATFQKTLGFASTKEYDDFEHGPFFKPFFDEIDAFILYPSRDKAIREYKSRVYGT